MKTEIEGKNLKVYENKELIASSHSCFIRYESIDKRGSNKDCSDGVIIKSQKHLEILVERWGNPNFNLLDCIFNKSRLHIQLEYQKEIWDGNALAKSKFSLIVRGDDIIEKWFL
ncbi:MAG: hypothetical protein OXE77_00055 [Flavobacteriaceae bacterium]|nr:hypothetical protein [Flavobacteriaceae bacterium]MCY4267014.1 hypothetical protein [Flavobacteriaceae bacterium]